VKDFRGGGQFSLSEVIQPALTQGETVMNHKRHIYALIGAFLHCVLIKLCGESLTNGMLKILEGISKLRNQSRE
jgi:hypothetical protein